MACCYYKDKKSALDAALQLNNSFAEPLPWREVIRDTRSAERILERGKQYNYGNAKLIRVLEITPDEQRHLSTIIEKEEKNRRRTQKRWKTGRKERKQGAPTVERKTYLFACQQGISDKVARTKELRMQGMTQRAIAQILGVNQQTISRYLKIVLLRVGPFYWRKPVGLSTGRVPSRVTLRCRIYLCLID